MRVCNCALPYTSPSGFKVCENCSNNLEQDSTLVYETPISYWSQLVSRQYCCKKCGNNNQEKIHVTYNDEQELLFVHCLRCDYVWKEEPSDKQGEHGKKELEKLLEEE